MDATTGDNKIYARTGGTVFEVADGQAVILDALGDVMTTLNELGTEVWLELEQPRTVDQLVARLSRIHPTVAIDSLERDVRTFLEQLVAVSLVVAADAPG